MKLSAYPASALSAAAPGPVHDLRDLTVDELKLDVFYRPVVAEARARFALFRLLDQNYQDWASHLNSLLSPLPLDDHAAALGLDRLLLNYLHGAYALRLHFETSFQQRFRTDSSEQKKYKMLVDQLGQTSWPFAFFLDFRGHLQHRGLAIGHFKRTVTPTSVVVELTWSGADLQKFIKDWPRSKLTASRGTLEIVPLVREFHARLMDNYAHIILKTFFADLVPAADFYKKLAAEVRHAHPALSMVFRDGVSKAADPKLVFVPNDLFAELGLAPVAK